MMSAKRSRRLQKPKITAIVASELGRNGGGPVTVFVYGEDGMLIATKGIRTKSYS
jgi:hypothetical protein